MFRLLPAVVVIFATFHAFLLPIEAAAQKKSCAVGSSGCVPAESVTATIRVYAENGRYITLSFDTSLLPDNSQLQRILPISLGWLPRGTYSVKLLKITGKINVIDAAQLTRSIRLTPRNVWLAATKLVVSKDNELSTVALVIQPPVTQPQNPTPTATPMKTVTSVPTATSTVTRTPTASPVSTSIPVSTPTPTKISVATPTATPTPTPTKSVTPTPTTGIQYERDCTWRGHPARANSVGEMKLLSPYVAYIWDDFVCASWTEVAGATSYLVVIRDLLRGEKIVFLQENLKVTKIKIPATWQNSTYRMYVQPVFGSTPKMWVSKSFNLCKKSAGCTANPYDGGQ